MTDVSTITITELLRNFNQALVSLADCATKINIGYKENCAYDEWDLITQTVYSSLVKFPIRWGIQNGKEIDVWLPDYDVVYEDYSGLSFIGYTDEHSGKIYVFHSFSSKELPMDSIRVVGFDPEKQVVSNDIIETPLNNIQFLLFYREERNQLNRIDRISLS